MTLPYVIVNCTATKDLYDWGRANHVPVWIPIRQEVRHKPGHPPRTVNLAALPGYAFVPADRWDIFRHKVPPRFYTKPMALHPNGQPRTCAEHELLEMQAIINNTPEPVRSQPEATVGPVVGQRVSIIGGPFKEMVGTINRIRRYEYRLLVGKVFMNMPKELVSPHI